MALVRNMLPHAISLTFGSIEAGEDRNIDTGLAYEASLIANGDLLIIDAGVDPPAPPTKLSPVVAHIPYAASSPFDIDLTGAAAGDLLGADGRPAHPSRLLLAESAGRRSPRVKLADPFCPVTSDGLPISAAPVQSSGSNAQHFFVCSGASSTAVSTVLDSLKAAAYNPASHMKIGAIAIRVPSGFTWAPTNDVGNPVRVAANMQRFGEHGVATYTWRIQAPGDATNGSLRITQKWYAVPGVKNVLYCEYTIAPDIAASTNGTGLSGTGPVVISHMLEAKCERTGTAAYDATLDGISMLHIGVSAASAPSWGFLRCLSHPSAGHYFEKSGSPDSNQNIASGALPTGTDSLALTANDIYRGYLSYAAAIQSQPRVTFRFVLGFGWSEQDAKEATIGVPNVGPETPRRRLEQAISRHPMLPAATPAEQQAIDGHFASLTRAARTEDDHHPERYAYDGTPRRLLFGGIGRWNAVWAGDTPAAVVAMAAFDPGLVKDQLDYLLNAVMNQSTGFLRSDPITTATTQHMAMTMGRALGRYLAATGDTTFATTAYNKLKLLYQWWTTNAPSTNRHPNWPTVRLLTGTIDGEIQEVGPTTSSGNFPSGDDWTTSIAHDLCVSMSKIAEALAITADIAGWDSDAAAFKSALRTYCWDATQGWYQSTMKSTSPSGGQGDNLGRFQAVKTHRGYYALYYGIATPAQAATIRANAMNTTKMRGAYGMRTASVEWGSYNAGDWMLGGCRPYNDAALSVGLRRYGYDDDADAVLATMTSQQNLYGTTPESFNSDTGAPGYSRHMIWCAGMLIEAYLAKRAPELLYGYGTSKITA